MIFIRMTCGYTFIHFIFQKMKDDPFISLILLQTANLW